MRAEIGAPDTLDEVKTDACRRIDEAAGRARSRLMSSGAGIEIEYRQAAEAVMAWRQAGSPEDAAPSEVTADADYRGVSPNEAARDIADRAEISAAAIRRIRQARLSGKRDVNRATTAREVASARYEAEQSLEQISP